MWFGVKYDKNLYNKICSVCDNGEAGQLSADLSTLSERSVPTSVKNS